MDSGGVSCALSAEADLLKTLPCAGTILSMVLMLEIGGVERFPGSSPMKPTIDCDTRPAGQAHAGVEGGDMSPTKEWNIDA